MPARLITTLLAVLTWALAWPSPTGATSWRAPTDGRITCAYAFDRGRAFAPGRHRGADFAAVRGAPVRAPCTGRIVVASRIGTSGGVVTVACGPSRASVLPLARISVHAGDRVTAGTPVGAAGRSPAHDGVHLGVRRARDPLGYVDPVPLIRAPRIPPPIPVTGPRGPARRRGVPPHAARPSLRPAPRTSPRRAPRPSARRALLPVPRASTAARAAPARPIAPWPVWAALGALLLAAGGRGVSWRSRALGSNPAHRVSHVPDPGAGPARAG